MIDKNPNADLLTLAEVSELLRVSPSSVRQMEKSGTIPSYRFGKKLVRFKKDEVLNLLKPKNHE